MRDSIGREGPIRTGRAPGKPAGATRRARLEAPDEPAGWRHRAACRDEDPELFFPVGNTGPAVLQIDDAKAVCGRCPVANACLSWALATGQDAGVWGGMSEGERRSLKRSRARAASRAVRGAL